MSADYTPPTTPLGFDVDCPLCGEHMRLTMIVRPTERFKCSACAGTFTLDGAVDHFRKEMEAWIRAGYWIVKTKDVIRFTDGEKI